MKKLCFLILFTIFSFSIFATPFTDALSIFIGKQVEIVWTRYSGYDALQGKITEVIDDGIFVDTGDKIIFINRLFLVKIDMRK